MITAIIIIIAINIIWLLTYLLYVSQKKNDWYRNFKQFNLIIGTKIEYTEDNHNFLIQNKLVMETYKKYIDVNLSTIPDQMANPSLTDGELRRLQWKFQAYLEISRWLKALIESNPTKL